MKYTLLFVLFLLVTVPLRAQQAGPEEDSATAAPEVDAEEQALRRAVREANGSQVDIVRALEKHLGQFPKSKRREEIEYVLLKSATDLDDEERIAKYGQLFLDTGANDSAVLDRVIPLLLRDSSEPMARRVLAYAKRYEQAAQSIHDNRPAAAGLLASWKRRRDRAFARAYVFQARAEGNLGNVSEAIKLARRSYDIDPSAEAARELGRWHAKLGQTAEAMDRYAEAFAIEDDRNDARHREDDLARLRELHRAAKGSDTGLGDLVLAARDRTQKALQAKAAELAVLSPNATARKPAEFTLSALDGEPLRLDSLRGKVVVVDFWATWCGPCRKQHPLYEQVKSRFQEESRVVFLSVNTDEDRDVVRPFLEENGWSQKVYFEDGLAGHLRISSIPTTLILGGNGAIFSRMNGFIPETFVDQLTERVQDALQAAGEPLSGARQVAAAKP
jgi:thiol-disulfide isomerase/thioredoxin